MARNRVLVLSTSFLGFHGNQAITYSVNFLVLLLQALREMEKEREVEKKQKRLKKVQKEENMSAQIKQHDDKQIYVMVKMCSFRGSVIT